MEGDVVAIQKKRRAVIHELHRSELSVVGKDCHTNNKWLAFAWPAIAGSIGKNWPGVFWSEPHSKA